MNRLQVLRKIEFMHDANKGESDLTFEINKYARQRELAFEGTLKEKQTG